MTTKKITDYLQKLAYFKKFVHPIGEVEKRLAIETLAGIKKGWVYDEHGRPEVPEFFPSSGLFVRGHYADLLSTIRKTDGLFLPALRANKGAGSRNPNPACIGVFASQAAPFREYSGDYDESGIFVGHSWDDTIKLMIDGWREGAKEILQMQEHPIVREVLESIKAPTRVLAPSGGRVNMGAYLANLPYQMMRQTTDQHKNRGLHIMIDMTTHCGACGRKLHDQQPPPVIEMFIQGAILAGAIARLRAVGWPVKVTATSWTTHPKGATHVDALTGRTQVSTHRPDNRVHVLSQVTLLDWGDHLNIPRLAFMIAHPAFRTRFIARIEELAAVHMAYERNPDATRAAFMPSNLCPMGRASILNGTVTSSPDAAWGIANIMHVSNATPRVTTFLPAVSSIETMDYSNRMWNSLGIRALTAEVENTPTARSKECDKYYQKALLIRDAVEESWELTRTTEKLPVTHDQVFTITKYLTNVEVQAVATQSPDFPRDVFPNADPQVVDVLSPALDVNLARYRQEHPVIADTVNRLKASGVGS